LQLGREPIQRVENHHNFAWKEIHEGRELIVHRKGATPAGKDVLGMIPGSMAAPGFIVKGKGQSASLFSAAHGAGRRMSRTNALKSITDHLLRETLEKYGVKLIGGGLDEAPQVYKDIEEVMRSQQQLVDIVGRFVPKIVKMDGTKNKQWGKRKEDMNLADGE
jgi:tRNA-splicing ligase RtcB (3'-phosphate/5'-hydroxy nucleic acid ligase)